ncbi:MAG: rod shape-determining protein MreC [Lactobacillales bacterium]|nr:rod shape-determining protein MreC [Lactobacillales bacterium]
MNKKGKINKKILIALITIIIISVTSTVTLLVRSNTKGINPLQQVSDAPIGLVDKVLYAPVHFFRSVTTNISEVANTFEENAKLKAKLDDYQNLKVQSRNDAEEIANLKHEVDLQATLREFDKTTANVINRSPDAWQDIIVIDKGKSAGVEVDQAVMSGKGLIGRVISVTNSSAKVELLTSSNQNSNHFPIKITTKDGDEMGLLTNYSNKDELLMASEITSPEKVSVGDVVQTSGLGGGSPADLLVGVVERIDPDKMGLGRIVYIRPFAKFYGLQFVTVIKSKVQADATGGE